MRIFRKSLPLFFVLVCATVLHAQPESSAPSTFEPGRTLFPQNDRAYSDSIKFKKVFSALLPIVRSKVSIMDRTRTQMVHFDRSVNALGLDTAEAHKLVWSSIDPDYETKSIYASYRSSFTADELEHILDFFQTPAGKHYLADEKKLVDARTIQIDNYVMETTTNIMRRMQMAKMEKDGGPPMPLSQPGGAAPPAPPTR